MTRPTRPESELTPFGHWLITQLNQRALKRADLARLTTSSSGTVSDWLYYSTPTTQSCTAIANALLLPIDTVLIAAGHKHTQPPPATATHQEAANLLSRIPEALLVPLVPMLRALADHHTETLHRITEALNRD